MTVASDSTYEFTINLLVKQAYRIAGLLGQFQELTEEDASYGRDMLELTLKALEAEGLTARMVGEYVLPLAVGTDRYDLPATVLNTVGNGMFIASSETNLEQASSELLVMLDSRDQWQERSGKAAEGRPTYYFPFRAGAVVQVRFWPIPDDAGHVRFQVQRLLANAQDGNSTLDLERHWQLGIAFRLASMLAMGRNRSLERVAFLKSQGDQSIALARGASNQQSDTVAYVEHDCGYYN